MKPTKPAIEISDADRTSKRKILITDKCTMGLKKWREKGESFRVDRYRCIEGRILHQIMSAKTKVTKTKTALKQETYNLSDLKHDLHCGFIELLRLRSPLSGTGTVTPLRLEAGSVTVTVDSDCGVHLVHNSGTWPQCRYSIYPTRSPCALLGSGHSTGRIYVTLKQVSEVLSMGSAWKNL